MKSYKRDRYGGKDYAFFEQIIPYASTLQATVAQEVKKNTSNTLEVKIIEIGSEDKNR